ncbi:MAG: hypothetical protein ACQES2_09630 [Pseudomonadota bacterium]
MDEIAGITLAALLKILRYTLWDILFQVVIYSLGRFALLTLTLGKFPRAHHLPRYDKWIFCAGVGVVFAIWLAIVIYNRTVGAA